VTRPAPIGVFDSGVGGLSVVRALIRRLPAEGIYYVADGCHCPYGSRPADEIRRWSKGISRFLIEQGCKVIVVACNTASAAALERLRQDLPGTPFVGMVPAVKPAARQTRTGVVGVLATEGTFHGQLYGNAIADHARDIRVISRPCEGLVEQVEKGDLAGPETVALLTKCVAPMMEAGADTLVLGCTHYPFLIPTLRRLVGNRVTVLQPSEAVARQTERVLAARGLLENGGGPGHRTYATSGDAASFAQALADLMRETAPEVSHLSWQGTRLFVSGETTAGQGLPPCGL